MKDEICRRLTEMGIRFDYLEHAPAHTMEECAAPAAALQAVIPANLFLRPRRHETYYLLLAQFAFAASIPENADWRILLFVPAVSRCGSSLAVTVLKPMNTSQYADQQKPKSHIAVLLAMTAVFIAAGFLLCGRCGFALLGCLAGYGIALCKAYKSLEGMNGDISGYALTLSELAAVAVWALL